MSDSFVAIHADTALSRKSCIVALDDDPTVRALFHIAFRNLPVQFLNASSEADALRLIKQMPADLLLIDLQLGSENGLDVSERLLAGIGKTIPVIAVTAESSSLLDSEVRIGRCSGYVLKPISLNTFGEEILRYLPARAYSGELPAKIIETTPSTGSINVDFVQIARENGRNLLMRTDGDLLSDGLMARVAHQWIGASGLNGIPDISIPARALEGLAKNQGQSEDVRRLLMEIIEALRVE